MKRLLLTAFICAMLPFQIFGEDIPRAYGPSSVEPGSKIIRARGFFGQSEHLYSGDILNGIYGYGYGLTSFATSPGVSIKLKASQDWTGSAQGTKITFETTPNASTTATEVLSIGQDGTLAVTGPATVSSTLGVTGVSTLGRVNFGLQLSTAPLTSSTLIFNSTGTLVFNTTDSQLCISTGSLQTSFVLAADGTTACSH